MVQLLQWHHVRPESGFRSAPARPVGRPHPLPHRGRHHACEEMACRPRGNWRAISGLARHGGGGLRPTHCRGIPRYPPRGNNEGSSGRRGHAPTGGTTAAQVGGIAAADSSGRSAVAAPARLRGTDSRPLEGPTDARSLAPRAREWIRPEQERVADLAALSATAGAPVIDLRPGFSHEEVATDSMWREAWRATAGSPPEATDGRGLAAADRSPSIFLLGRP